MLLVFEGTWDFFMRTMLTKRYFKPFVLSAQIKYGSQN